MSHTMRAERIDSSGVLACQPRPSRRGIFTVVHK